MDDDMRRRYLLGTLDDETSQALERDYLADADAMERMRVVEDELVEAYVSGELDAAERTAFEARLAIVPEWPARVAFARALVASAEARSAEVALPVAAQKTRPSTSPPTTPTGTAKPTSPSPARTPTTRCASRTIS
jgi:anti-sigma factor RsiW